MTSGGLRAFAHKVGSTTLIAAGCLAIGFFSGLIVGGFVPSVGGASDATSGVTLSPGTSAATAVVMPDVRGLSEHTARQALADLGLGEVPVSIERQPYVAAEGFVVAQAPIAGTQNPERITLALPVPASMSNLAGRAEEAASTALQDLGAQVRIIRRYVEGVTPGEVVETKPGPGKVLSADAMLVISADPQQIYLADLWFEGRCSRGTASANGERFEHAVLCRASQSQPTTAVWLLNRRVTTLTGVLGIDDESDPATRYAVKIDGDGRRLLAAELSYGESIAVTEKVKGVLRLTVTLSRLDAGASGEALVLGDLVLIGADVDLATLPRR